MTNAKLLDELSNALFSKKVKKAHKLAELLLIESMSANRIMKTLLRITCIEDNKYLRNEYFVLGTAAAVSATKEALNLQPLLKVES
jgi:hypothetical protein